MPVKNPDPFFEFIDKLDPKVNPYVDQLKTHVANQSLPLTYGQDLKRYAGRWKDGISFFYLNKPEHQRPMPLSSPSGEPLLSMPFESLTIESKNLSAPAPNLAPEMISPASRLHPLILEIGCHNGHTLTQLALDHPTWNFVGLDITFKRIVTTAERLSRAGVRNAVCALANAQNLSQIFAHQELDGIVIFFPDPWVKKARQTKNRLVNERFMAEIKRCLNRNGFIWFKSDQKVYFDQVVSLMEGHGFSPVGPLPPGINQNYSSRFEDRFHSQGLPTFGCVFQKQDA